MQERARGNSPVSLFLHNPLPTVTNTVHNNTAIIKHIPSELVVTANECDMQHNLMHVYSEVSLTELNANVCA